MKNKMLTAQLIYTLIIFIFFQIQQYGEIDFFESVFCSLFVIIVSVATKIVLMSFESYEKDYKMKIKEIDKIRVAKVCAYLSKVTTIFFIFNVILIVFGFLDFHRLQGETINLYVFLITAPMWLTIRYYLRNYSDAIKDELEL